MGRILFLMCTSLIFVSMSFCISFAEQSKQQNKIVAPSKQQLKIMKKVPVIRAPQTGTFQKEFESDAIRCRGFEQIVEPAPPQLGTVDRGLLFVQGRVKNESDHVFNSPVGELISAKVVETGEQLFSFSTNNITSVPAGATVTLDPYYRVSPPTDFIRWGHNVESSGECLNKIAIKSRLLLDPDLHLDDDTSNDDCSFDNVKTYYVNYTAECP